MTEFISVIEIKDTPVNADMEKFIERLGALPDGEYAVTVSTLAGHTRKQQNTFYMVCRWLGKALGYKYDEWIMQLAAYNKIALCDGVANLIIDKGEPGKFLEINYNAEEVERGWQLFHHSKEIWKIQKKYDPGVV